MNKLKHQLDISDDRKIKFQKTYDQRNKSINCLENLSNEIFYEIFDYLDGWDIYQTFVGLNSRFRHILIHLSIPLKFNLHKKSNTLLDICEKLIVSLKHRHISLNLDRIIKPCGLMLLTSSFDCLESLTFNLSDDQQLNSLPNLSSLPRLFALTLNVHQRFDYNKQVYPQIFSLPKLKYAKLSSNISTTSDTLPIMTTTSSLERLITDHDCAFYLLLLYLSYTPELLRLVCKKKLLMGSELYTLPKLMIQSVLTHIHINECYLEFEEFKLFIAEISSQLKVLRISSVYDRDYLNADRWEKLICQYIPHLSILEFKYTEFIDKKFQVDLHHQTIYKFITSFWIERQWFLQYKIGVGKNKGGIISYFIQPYEKHSLIDKYDPSPIQLTIINSVFLKWFRSFIKCIEPGLCLFNITRLVFENHGIYIRILLSLIQILSNLNSLVISSFILGDKKSLSIPKTNTLRKMNNKITKLHIKRVNILEEIQYLIYLCPQIDVLEIDDINRINFEGLLQFILIKHRKNISLNLRNFQYDEKKVQQLKNIINNEKLNNNFRFTQTFNNMHLEIFNNHQQKM